MHARATATQRGPVCLSCSFLRPEQGTPTGRAGTQRECRLLWLNNSRFFAANSTALYAGSCCFTVAVVSTQYAAAHAVRCRGLQPQRSAVFFPANVPTTS